MKYSGWAAPLLTAPVSSIFMAVAQAPVPTLATDQKAAPATQSWWKGWEFSLVLQYGFTALILAAGMGNREMVELLVQRSDLAVNVVEGNSCSALMIACMHCYIQARYDIVRYPGDRCKLYRYLCSGYPIFERPNMQLGPYRDQKLSYTGTRYCKTQMCIFLKLFIPFSLFLIDDLYSTRKGSNWNP